MDCLTMVRQETLNINWLAKFNSHPFILAEHNFMFQKLQGSFGRDIGSYPRWSLDSRLKEQTKKSCRDST